MSSSHSKWFSFFLASFPHTFPVAFYLFLQKIHLTRASEVCKGTVNAWVQWTCLQKELSQYQKWWKTAFLAFCFFSMDTFQLGKRWEILYSDSHLCLRYSDLQKSLGKTFTSYGIHSISLACFSYIRSQLCAILSCTMMFYVVSRNTWFTKRLF